MKLRKFIFTVLSAAALAVGCNKEVELGPAKLEVNPTDLSFEASLDTQDITILATRDWSVSSLPDWIGLSQENGVGDPSTQILTLTVLDNAGFNRSADVVFSIGFDRRVITVKQEGPGGEQDNGKGTKADPFNVAGVLEYIAELGADHESEKNVFVKGVVCAVTDPFGTDYGSGTFNIITNEESANEQFTVYRAYYLGNKKWTANDPQIKVGDEVVVYGKVINHKGTTPETVQNKAFVFSLNGEDRGGADDEPSGDESLEPASDTNVAGLVARISDSATKDAPTVIADFNLAGATVTYVNGSSAFIEDGSGAVLLYKSGHGLKAGDKLSGTINTSGYYRYGAPQLLSLEGYTKVDGEAPAPTEMDMEKLLNTFKSQVSRFIILKGVTVTDAIADGDRKGVIKQGEKTIDVYAQLNNQGLKMELDATGDFTCFPTYNNATKQVSFYDNAHFTANGGGDEPGGGDDPTGEETEKGTGTQEDPYNPLAAKNIAAALEPGAKTETDVYIKGIISSVKYAFNASKGTATFTISEDGKTTSTQFDCYSVYYYENQPWVEGNDQVAVGNEVLICGKLTNYNGTPETSNKEAWIVSMTAGEPTPGPGPEPSGDAIVIDFSTKGYENGTQHTVTEQDGITVKFGDGTNDGKYYDTGKAMRVYGGGYAQVSANANIVKIVYTWDSGVTKEETGAYGYPNDAFPATVDAGTYDQASYTWTGSATSVKMSRGTGNGHWRLQKVVVYLEGGSTPGGDDDEPKLPVNDGLTEATAFTVQDAIYVAQHGADATKEYYVNAVVGKDITIKNGSASFELIDGTTAEKLSVVKAKGFNGADFDGSEPLDWLDEVVLKGKVATLAGSLPVLQNAVLVKWNGKSSWTEPEPSGNDGLTPETAFLASEANAWIMANLESGKNTGTAKYYVKGKVQRYYQSSGVDQNFTNNSHKQASFFITDDGNASTAEFEAYQINYLGGATYEAGQTDVVVGDEVMVYGPLARYNNTVAETQGKGNAYLYSLNGATTPDGGQQGGGQQGGGDEPGNDPQVTSYAKVTAAPASWAGTYLMVAEAKQSILNGFSSTPTVYGTGLAVTIDNAVIAGSEDVDACQITIAPATVTEGAYTLKLGNSYLNWTSGNSLTGVAEESANSNWTISLDQGNVFIVNATDSSRKIRWNNSSPRFATYTSAQTDIQLYKLSE